MKKKLLLGFAAMLLSWTAWAAFTGQEDSQLVITLTENGTSTEIVKGPITYAGDKTQPGIKVQFKYLSGDETKYQDLTEDDYDIAYTLTKQDGTEENPTVVREAGHYVMTVTGKGLQTGRSGKIEFDVEPKTVENVRLTLVSAEKTYGENDQVALKKLVQKTDVLKAELESNAAATGENDPEFENFLACLQVDRYEDATGEDVLENNGSYQVIVNGKAEDAAKAANSNYRYVAPDVKDAAKLKINPLVLTVNVTKETYKGDVYDPSELKLTVTYTDAEGKEVSTLPFGDKLTTTLTAATATESLRDAKDYTLNVQLGAVDKDQNEGHATKTSNYSVAATTNFTIAPAELTIQAGTDGIWSNTYGNVSTGADLTTQFDIATWQGTDNNNAELKAKLAMKWYEKEAPTAAGSYAIKAYWEGKEVTDGKIPNYMLKYKYEEGSTGWFFAITGKAINSEGITIEMAPKDLVYNGAVFTEGNVTLTVKDGESNTLVKNTDYEIVSVKKVNPANDEAAKNAGDKFIVTIKGIGNYLTNDNTTLASHEDGQGFEITKRELTITPKAKDATEEDAAVEYVFIGKTYGDNEPTTAELMEFYEFDGLVDGEDINTILTMARATDIEANNPNNKNVNTEYAGEYTVRLYNAAGVVKSADYGKSFGNYKVIYDVNAEKYPTRFVIKKKDLHYSIAATKTYDGTEALPESPTYTLKTEELVNNETLGIDDSEATAATLFTANPTVTVESENAKAQNAGKYTLTVAEGSEAVAVNYNLIYTETAENYEIIARALTITGPTVSKDFGASIPTAEELAILTGYTYTTIENGDTQSSGQLADDRRALRKIMYLTIEDEDALAGASGEYPIVINFTEDEDLTEFGYENVATLLANYGGLDIIKKNTTNGTLTIGEVTGHEVVLDGSIEKSEESDEELTEDQMTVAQKIAKYNGAKVKTVIVKNLRARDEVTYKGEKWYTLVLPFKISVRDLSNAFGYAIVNVPDVNNTDSELAKFRLTMGEIEPNTLIVFKVDETDKIVNDITFTDKTIVEPAKDEEGNYVWYTDPAGVTYKGVYEDYTTKNKDNEYWIHTDGTFWNGSVTLHPLSGFISYATTPAAARLSLENPDGSTTVIDAITMETVKSADGWYTTGGMKLSGEPTQKGVYINNGKKVVIK